MTEDLTIYVPAMHWVGEKPIEGIERSFVVYMLYQALIDARAIANRNVYNFHELRMNDAARKHQHGKMWVIEQADRRLRRWIASDQFAWYCELLHWNTRRVREKLVAIIEGREEEGDDGDSCLPRGDVPSVRTTAGHNSGVYIEMRRHRSSEEEIHRLQTRCY